jgi:hypothetical protein
METITADRSLTRHELADRYSLPVKIPALGHEGHRTTVCKFGRRYLLSDVNDWEREQFDKSKRDWA